MPLRYGGAYRKVYPGFVQLAAFMSMNIERHVKAHRDALRVSRQRRASRRRRLTKDFYDEYFAVLDSPRSSIWRRCGRVPGAQLPTGQAELARRAGRAARDQAHRCCSRSKARRTTSARSARPRPRMICARAAALPQAPPHADRRRPLRRVQRQALGRPDLSAGEERHPVERVNLLFTGACLSPFAIGAGLASS